jgi:DNA polymerase
MKLITADLETYYDKEYSLSKMTTEEYIRDPRFEVIGLSIKVDDGETMWGSGTHEQIKRWLHTFDWSDAMLLAHNTMFDGAILSWVFDVHPKALADTLCMGRALDGVDVGGSLAAMAKRYGLGEKGTEVVNALGKRRADFTEEELSRYGDYCINDVELTYKLFRRMAPVFPKTELKLIDMTLRMFTEPHLELDRQGLETHLKNVRQHKNELLIAAGITDKKDLMSNTKFAELLQGLGVEPPRKISPTTGKETFAFAKTDDGFKALLEHEDDRVQALAAARLGNKSTLEESRTERFIGIAERGKFPVPIKYYAAHTGRWGGADKVNVQNLPSRGPNAKAIKNCIMAPEGYVLVDCDSSQIEARVLAWLAGQWDLVEAFANKEDVYIKMASRIYGKPEDQIDKHERFVGKTTILGSGYGMGAVKFQAQLKNFGVDVDLDEARRIISIYRETNPYIVKLWRDCQDMLKHLANGQALQVGREGVLEVDAVKGGIRLPSGLLIYYPKLHAEQGEKGPEYVFETRKGPSRIYGGKCVENGTQAIARCVVGEQMLRISKRYKPALTVHDSVVVLVPEAEQEEGRAWIEEQMRWVPPWAEGLPVDCESDVGRRYGAGE